MRDGYDTEARERWAENRRRMEAGDEKHTPDGRRHHRRWGLFKHLIVMFGWSLRATGLFHRGVRNARDIRIRRLELAFDNLPTAFDGYTLLHLTDLHFDALPDTTDRLVELIEDVDVDVCVLTGDYRFRVHGPVEPIMPGFRQLAEVLTARDGVFAVLGNHDTADMVEPIESLGIAVLINRTQPLLRQGDVIHLIGVDDVHYYYTDDADAALREQTDGFRIALVHSPEIADRAAAAGIDLYLTGHTHGGQVCLPGGRPIITHAGKWRAFAAGLWRHGGMIGYTSSGIGVSGLPVRFNNRGEAVLITLRRNGIGRIKSK